MIVSLQICRWVVGSQAASERKVVSQKLSSVERGWTSWDELVGAETDRPGQNTLKGLVEALYSTFYLFTN